jgi:hypothetical protein
VKRRGFVVGYKERAENMKERIKGLNESKGFFFIYFFFGSLFQER